MQTAINVRAGISSTRVSPQAARVLRNTYLLLAISLLPAIGGAALGISHPPVTVLGMWGTLAAFFVALFGLQAMIIRNRNSAAGIGWLFAFTGALGYFLGDMLAVALSLKNGVELIGLAVGGTAALFFCLAGYATVTSRNFATPSMYKVLFIGMMMAFVMMIANIFIQMPIIGLSLSALFMIISSAYIVVVVNAIVRGGETNYITATLTLFVMIYNLFASLLHLLMAFGGRE